MRRNNTGPKLTGRSGKGCEVNIRGGGRGEAGRVRGKGRTANLRGPVEVMAVLGGTP